MGVAVSVSTTVTPAETVGSTLGVPPGTPDGLDTSVVGITETPEGSVTVIPSSGIVAGVAAPVSGIETPKEIVGTAPGVSDNMPDGKETSVVGTMKTLEGGVSVTSFCENDAGMPVSGS